MFEKELKKFREIQEHLKNEYPSEGFVVIYGDEVLGVWFNRLDALKEGISKYGNVPFLVKDIHEDLDEIIYISRDIEFV